MSNPDEIRADIEMTRGELGRDVDALADKVSPPKIMERQRTRARQALGDVKSRLMGAADEVGDTATSAGRSVGDAVGGAVGAAGDAVRELPHKARQTTQGAPLVVGLLAAGVGFLVASLIPASSAETRLSASLRDQAQPLVDKAVDEAKDAAQEVAQNLKGPAQDAVDEVKESAMSSAETVKQEAQDTTERVRQNVTTPTGQDASGSQGMS